MRWLIIPVLLSGCVTLEPPEMRALQGHEADVDSRVCFRSDAVPDAVAACKRVIARADVSAWPGMVGRTLADMVILDRSAAALRLSQLYGATGETANSCVAVRRAAELLQKVSPERFNDPPRGSASAQNKAQLNRALTLKEQIEQAMTACPAPRASVPAGVNGRVIG